jgi:hypothetical protein
VALTADNGFIITGRTRSFGADDLWLIRTDSIGDTIWTRTFGGAYRDAGYSVQQTADGGYVVAGWTNAFGAGMSDAWVIKTDESGDSLWTRTYGGENHDACLSVAETADGGYAIAGYTYSTGPLEYDAWLIKTDEHGGTLWTRTYEGPTDHTFRSVAPTEDGGCIITGKVGSDEGISDLWLVKMDSEGDITWTRTHEISNEDMGFEVQPTEDGGYVIVGATVLPDTWYHMNLLLLRTDSVGDALWTQAYRSRGQNYGMSVQQTTDGGFIVVGWVWNDGVHGFDAWLIKTDSMGSTTAIAEARELTQAQPQRPTILTRAHLLTELHRDPTLSLFDAAGRQVNSPKTGVVFLRSAIATRKVLITD